MKDNAEMKKQEQEQIIRMGLRALRGEEVGP